MSGFGFKGFAIGSDKHRGHESQAPETLSDDVRLYVTVVVLQRHYVPSGGLHHLSDHVVNEAVFIPDLFFLKQRGVLAVVDRLEDIFEAAVVGFKDGVLGGEVQREGFIESELEARVCKAGNGGCGIVLCLGHAAAVPILEFKDLDSLGLAAGGGIHHLQGSWLVDDHVFCAVLVPESVPSDDYGLLPPRD